MHFCFYGSGIYDSLKGKPPGGAELQVALLAKVLSEKGHQVTIVDNKGNGSNLVFGGIVVRFTGKSKIKGLRLFTEKIPNSFRYLMKAKADYYYVRGFSYLYIIPLFIARHLKLKFVLGFASDIDVMSFKQRFKYVFRTRISVFNWFKNDLASGFASVIMLRKADIRLVQHYLQQASLTTRGIDSFIFPNILLPESIDQSSEYSDSFVYVGSLCERKGLSEFVELVENCKGGKFRIIGLPQGSFASSKVDIFKKNPNITFLGQISRNEVLKQISASKGLLNFSMQEGFPNTFLEAWFLGIPVFSLWVDPGGVIQKYNLGKCFHGDLNSMASFLKSYEGVTSNKHLKDYIEQNHSYSKAAERFVEIINDSQ